MPKTDTLPKPHPRSSLHELLMRLRDGGADSTVLPDTQQDEERPVSPEGTDSRPPIVERRRRRVDHAPVPQVRLEPVDRQPYDLSYACLLIPRFSSHYLIGDISESLRTWLRTICISFEWRLEDMWVRPAYMQWVLYVPANTPPSHCIRTIRDQTSLQIFEDFPQIRKQNLSQDFWAPGYLVLIGPTPHPPEMINQFIRLTRQKQGFQPRSSE
jgi:REP element-mobilizing transposase RayT